jgi:hypothetical protein
LVEVYAGGMEVVVVVGGTVVDVVDDEGVEVVLDGTVVDVVDAVVVEVVVGVGLGVDGVRFAAIPTIGAFRWSPAIEPR